MHVDEAKVEPVADGGSIPPASIRDEKCNRCGVAAPVSVQAPGKANCHRVMRRERLGLKGCRVGNPVNGCTIYAGCVAACES